jgi:hypothetical protein
LCPGESLINISTAMTIRKVVKFFSVGLANRCAQVPLSVQLGFTPARAETTANLAGRSAGHSLLVVCSGLACQPSVTNAAELTTTLSELLPQN